MVALRWAVAGCQRGRNASAGEVWSVWQTWRFGIKWFVIYELCFPIWLVWSHQFFVHYWNSRIGFLNSWSISVVVLVGDTLLSIALAACRVQVQLVRQRYGHDGLPGWAASRKWSIVSLAVALLLGYIWQVVLPGSRLSATQHNYALVYDSSHVLWTGYVTYQASRAVLRSWYLWRAHQLRGVLLVCALVAGLMWAPYTALRTYNPPRQVVHTGYTFDTGQWGERFSNHLFIYGEESSGEP